MTIKKTLSVKRPSQASATAAADDGETVATAAASSGGATIADRFKLDTPASKPSGQVGVGTKIAVAAAVIALLVAGVLTYTLYGHWEFLKGA